MQVPHLSRCALMFCASIAILTGCGANALGPVSHDTVSSAIGTPNYGRATSSYRVVFNFNGGDGRTPAAGLTDVRGTLYGTTDRGGSGDHGLVFSVTPSGTEQALYKFKGQPDGVFPLGDLINVNGTLYGTTYFGGKNGYGTVFSLTLGGKERVLYSFKGGSDGANPHAGLTYLNGVFYGTTENGGKHKTYYPAGTVFKVVRSGSGYAESVLYRFNGDPTDGASPESRLTPLNGLLYGTTWQGGQSAAGTIFSITTNGNERVLYAFTGRADGLHVPAGLTALNGTLYGTTISGGYNFHGTVFSISTGAALQTLYEFKGNGDGSDPDANLTALHGTLYGTTYTGGVQRRHRYEGTVFSVSTTGSEKVLHLFTGRDGGDPVARLSVLNDTLYGTAAMGGTSQRGVVFELTS
jgi:uncharacterized repeat protein (TIGR03803 family)